MVPFSDRPPGDTVPLTERYVDCDVFTDRERLRFRRLSPKFLDWELLYRHEPELYERLIAGETLHPGILQWFPTRISRAVEMAAGSGRFTVLLAPRCDELVAIEPAAPLRERLRRRKPANTEVRDGFFDAIPVPDSWADLVCTCSALIPEHGPEALAEMERVCAPGGLVVVVWPFEAAWLETHGYEHLSFPGAMVHRFSSVEEARQLATIFYPQAVEQIESRDVPYEVLGLGAPRDLCFKVKPRGTRKGL
jgi:SAM-dependent methyltransferase